MVRFGFAGCELSAGERVLRRDGSEHAVEPKVFDLLLYMIEQRGRFLSREELLDAVWPGAVVSSTALSRAIKEARRAVGDDGERQAVIATVHGRGYRFVAQVVEEQAAVPGSAPSAGPAPVASDRDQTTQPRAASVVHGAATAGLAITCVWPASLPTVQLPAAGAVLRLGRGTDCNLALVAPDVSRAHAEIARDGPNHVLRDLHSTNGTFLNGDRIDVAPLAAGDVVRLGDAVLVVSRLSEHERGDPRELGPELLGSAVLERALAPLRVVARDRLPISLVGETGVGKERVARAIHAWSERGGAFVALNCAALAGAQAGAGVFGGSEQPGVLASADGGTVLLDHVTMLPGALQAALLRVIEHGELITPDGGRIDAVDLRVIATSQEPLDHALRAGTLRPDFHALLSADVVELPPLRDRPEDVPALFSRFACAGNGGRMPAVSASLLERLCLYDWPYNVRELEALVRRLLLEHAHEPPLCAAHLPAHVDKPGAARPQTPAPGTAAGLVPLLDALRAHGGNVSDASSAVGMTLADAYRAME